MFHLDDLCRIDALTETRPAKHITFAGFPGLTASVGGRIARVGAARIDAIGTTEADRASSSIFDFLATTPVARRNGRARRAAIVYLTITVIIKAITTLFSRQHLSCASTPPTIGIAGLSASFTDADVLGVGGAAVAGLGLIGLAILPQRNRETLSKRT